MVVTTGRVALGGGTVGVSAGHGVSVGTAVGEGGRSGKGLAVAVGAAVLNWASAGVAGGGPGSVRTGRPKLQASSAPPTRIRPNIVDLLNSLFTLFAPLD